jgi:hypothetical protein
MRQAVDDPSGFGKIRGPVPPIHKKGGKGGGISPLPVQTGVALPGDFEGTKDAPYNLRDFILPKSDVGKPLDSYGGAIGGMSYGNDSSVRSHSDAIGIVDYAAPPTYAEVDHFSGYPGISEDYSGGKQLEVVAGNGGKFGNSPGLLGPPDISPYDKVVGPPLQTPNGKGGGVRGPLPPIRGDVGGGSGNPYGPNDANTITGPPLQAPPVTPGQLDDQHLADLLTGILGPTGGPLPAGEGGAVGGSPALVIPITADASPAAEAPKQPLSKGVILMLVVGAAVVVFIMWRHNKK